MNTNIIATNYSHDVVMADAMIGVLASGFIIVISLLLGGFSFFAPWMISAAAVLFSTGLIRAQSEGNIWLKSAAISVASFLFAILFGNLPLVGIAVPFLILPCASGIWIRRRRQPTTAPSE